MNENERKRTKGRWVWASSPLHHYMLIFAWRPRQSDFNSFETFSGTTPGANIKTAHMATTILDFINFIMSD